MTDIVLAAPIEFIELIEFGTPPAPELDVTSLPVIGSNFDRVLTNIPGSVSGVFLMVGFRTGILPWTPLTLRVASPTETTPSRRSR